MLHSLLTMIFQSLSDSEYGTLLQMRDEIYTSQENFNRRLAALDDRVVALDQKGALGLNFIFLPLTGKVCVASHFLKHIRL